MPRTNLVIALFALLAAALFAGPTLAHTSANHATRTAVADASAIAQSEANVGFLAIQNPKGVWPGVIARFVVDANSHQTAEDSCPETNDGCCDNQCCVGMDLVVGKPDLGPAFVSEPIAAPGARPPSDATPENQLRPPCR